jgi:hypothetical protein
MIGSATFSKEGQSLTISNFNRHKVEQNTGVDLVYYHHKFDAYVMIQYKRMKVETLKKGNRIVYRPLLDESYKKEIEKMKELQENFVYLTIKKRLIICNIDCIVTRSISSFAYLLDLSWHQPI